MSSETAKDSRSKRYSRLALVSALMLAFLWPLGNFFFWIFAGATAYFIFLSFYYLPRTPKTRPSGFKQPKPSQAAQPDAYAYGQSAQPTDDLKKKVRFVIFLISGTIIFIAIAVGLLTPAAEEFPPTEISTQDDTVDRAALQNDANDINALTNIGNRFYGVQQYDSALFYYERVLTIDPRNVVCLNNKALVLYQKQDFKQSLVWAKKSLSVDPSYTDALLLIGDGYYAQENYSEAIGWYQQAYTKDVRTPELLNVMAFIYDKQNKQGEAIRFYKETLQQDSSYVEAYKRLAELEPARKDWYGKKVEQWKLR